MGALIQFFVELCLLRRAPQDLPASEALLGITGIVNLVASVALGSLVGLSPGLSLAEALVDLVFTILLLYGAVRMLGRLPRFLQTATALLGAGTVLATVAVVSLGLVPIGDPGAESAPTALLFLVLIGWSLLVTGHILRHCFDLRLGQGVVVAVAYNLLSYSLISSIFSGS